MSDTEKRIALAYIELGEAILAKIDGPPGTASVAAPTPLHPQATPDAGIGVCPTHGTPWTTMKRDGTQARRAFCKTKVGNDWCDEQGPWLQPKKS